MNEKASLCMSKLGCLFIMRVKGKNRIKAWSPLANQIRVSKTSWWSWGIKKFCKFSIFTTMRWQLILMTYIFKEGSRFLPDGMYSLLTLTLIKLKIFQINLESCQKIVGSLWINKISKKLFALLKTQLEINFLVISKQMPKGRFKVAILG